MCIAHSPRTPANSSERKLTTMLRLRLPALMAVNVAVPFASFFGATGLLKGKEETKPFFIISIFKLIHTSVADF